MEHIHHIRYEKNVKEKSIREIEKETGHCYRTIKKYLEMDNFSEQVPVKSKRIKKRDKYKNLVKEWLEEDLKSPKKQRHTSVRVYNRLLEYCKENGEVLAIKLRTVNTLVREIKSELNSSETVDLPLLQPAGEAQVDFGQTVFYLNDKKIKGYHLALSFPHSNQRYMQLYPAQTSECLFEGMKTIFEHIGGVPQIIRFDNMSTAVAKINKDGSRKETEMMMRFKTHYGFQSVYCNKAKGNEKGNIENAVGYTRRNYFVPLPRIKNLEEYNKNLLKELDKELEYNHYKHGVKKAILFEEDKANFINLANKEFECVRYKEAKTNNSGIIIIENNKYSTGGTYRSLLVICKLSYNKVSIYDVDGNFIVEHDRLYGEHGESIKWGPYLKVLSYRPKALKYSGFYEMLGGDLKEFLERLEKQETKKVIEYLADISKNTELENIIPKMREALKISKSDADSYISALGFSMNIPVNIPKNAIPKGIQNTSYYEITFDPYQSLMSKKEGVKC